MALTSLGQDIFLDRYAQKHTDVAANIKVGDDVLVVTAKGRRAVGKVITHNTQDGTVDVQYTKSNDIDRNLPFSLLDLPKELTPEEMHERIAKGIASVEVDSDLWTKNFRWLLDDFKFVPAGRISATAGTEQKTTCYNCFVIKSPHDSRGGIMDNIKQMIEIMSHGGGVGVNLSSLRPQHALVRGVNGRSSGPVSWGQMYSTATGLIEQAGSRRGALLLMLNDWHPDIFTFIDSKRNSTDLLNCNISVGFSDRFMEALAAGENWTLRFPDTAHPAYNNEWDGDLTKWEAAGYPTIIYQTIPAQKIWDAVIASAHTSAEPGLFFLERYNKMSNSNYYAPIICCNPCSEQGLPADGVCNLGALNLAQFVENGQVQWSNLMIAISYAVRFLDDVIDWTPYFYEANEVQQKSERRVGLGTMGLAEMMIKLKIRYGSEKGTKFADELFSFLAYHAYAASVKLAQEKGAFPRFEADQFLSSGFMRGMPEDIRRHVREFGIRNVTLLTCAPTGTTGTMLNTSTGIEPFFALKWERASRLGTHTEYLPLAQAWLDAHPGQTLPDYFVTAMELSPEEHVYMQAAIQRWIDTSISKTVNAPKGYTVEQTKNLYQLMYDTGCKGGTIYVDESRSEQVLHLIKSTDLACPDCGSEMIREDGCETCHACGYSACAV